MLQRVLDWFVATGQMSPEPTPDARQTAFYVGMQLEELSEKIELIFSKGCMLYAWVAAAAEEFKNGEHDLAVAAALKRNPRDLLDADTDMLWVTLGSARAQGADIVGAFGHLTERNEAKCFPDGAYHRHLETGKVLKPEGWQPPNNTPFVHPTLRAPEAP